jgi:two-component system sensor histidine kinase UhpB
LTALELNLAEIEEELPSDLDPKIREMLADMHSIVERASEQISELSLDLRPSMLDDLGLTPTLRWHFNKISKRRSIEIKFETIDQNERLDSDTETVLFRISQEAINNIVKHADATNVMVRLQQKPEAIALTIKDNGKGFDIDEILTDHQRERIGILGMKERASMVGGSLSIQSRKGHGTQIFVEIPVGIDD